MAGGLVKLTQDQWDAGLFRNLEPSRIPENGAYDIVNGFLDAERGVIYRRGGSTYVSSAAGDNLEKVYSWGDRVLIGGADQVFVYDALGNTFLSLASSTYAVGPVRAATDNLAAYTYLTTGSRHAPRIRLTGGATSSYSYSTGTASVTLGSTTVTGTGTAWAPPVGAIFQIGNDIGVVEATISGTSLRLKSPWTGPTASGAVYGLGTTASPAPSSIPDHSTTPPVAVGASGRLVVGFVDTIAFSQINQPTNFAATDFHTVPDNGTVIDLVPFRDRLLVFTTVGLYAIDNMSLDLTDAAGDPQQTMTLIDRDLVLAGVGAVGMWRNLLVAPSGDNVYLMDGVSTPVQIGDSVSEFLEQPTGGIAVATTVGQAAVQNDHYLLPVSGDTETVLACNLETRAWSRVEGFSGGIAGFDEREVDGYQYAVRGERLVSIHLWWSPSSTYKNEPDGTTHEFQVTTRDFILSGLRGFCKKIRLWVEGVDAASDNPTITASYATGPAGSSFTSLGSTTAESTGDTSLTPWTVGVGGHRIRFKFSSTSPFASLKFKALDVFVRPKGRA